MLICFCLQYKNLENGSQKNEVLKQITETMRHRTHLDGSIELIGTFLYGPHKGSSIFNSVREPGMPLVDDWGCLKSMVTTLNLQLQFDFSLLSLHIIQFHNHHRFGCSKAIVVH